jgi:hypothetical protein
MKKENIEQYRSKANPIILFIYIWLLSPITIISDMIKIIKSKNESEFYLFPTNSKYWKLKTFIYLPFITTLFASLNKLYLLKEKGINIKPIYKNNNIFPSDEIIYIEAPRSFNKNLKLYFIDSNKIDVDTETIVYQYLKSKDLNVLRTEVAFWQALTALVYWDEIYDFNPEYGDDIPIDLFTPEFYINRKTKIDAKHQFIQKNGIVNILEKSINNYVNNNYFSRLVHDQNEELHISDPLIKTFIERIDLKQFCFITYNIVQSFNFNRAGLPDFIAWNSHDLVHIEAKRFKEKVLKSQEYWFGLFDKEEISYRIIRVKNK